MLSHEQVWAAIDALATRNGLSPSGLARRAGLDPTTFNPSKRIANDGRPRWPSTESLAKILDATGEPFNTFIMDKKAEKAADADTRLVPLITLGDGLLQSQKIAISEVQETIPFPDPRTGKLFALEITGDQMLPLYRDGDTVIAAPDSAIRRGDRVLVKVRNAPLQILLLHRQTSKTTEFSELDTRRPNVVLDHSEIDWIARIIWASQ